MIYSDYILNLNGGDSLDLDKWILEDTSKLNLSSILAQLNIHEVDYCKSSNNLGIRLKTKSGVELGFSYDLDEVVYDRNQLQL